MKYIESLCSPTLIDDVIRGRYRFEFIKTGGIKLNPQRSLFINKLKPEYNNLMF
jgi:hypothetical protein